MSDQWPTKTWADRVRTGVKDVTEYNKECEVTCRFKKITKRTEIHELLKKLNFNASNFEGIVQRPNGLVDFTLTHVKTALKFAEVLQKSGQASDITAYADCHIKVRVEHVPPRFPLSLISNYLNQNHGKATNATYLVDQYNIKNGVVTFKMEKKDLEQKPIVSYLYFGKYQFRVKYIGQNTTCSYCEMAGHIEKNCPEKVYMIKSRKTLKKMQKRIPRLSDFTEDENHNPTTQPENRRETQLSKSQYNDNLYTNNFDFTELQENHEDLPKPKASQSSDTSSVSENSESHLSSDSEDDKPTDTSSTDSEDENFNVNTDKIKKPKAKTNKRPRSESSSDLKTETTRSKNSRKSNQKQAKSIFNSTSTNDSFCETFLSCCKETTDNCNEVTTTCKCNSIFFKCNCRWKLMNKKVGNCDECKTIAVQCVQCNVITVDNDLIPKKCMNCNKDFDLDTY